MPTLTLLAGPNGAGKTTFIERFKKIGLLPPVVINLDNIPESVYSRLTGNVYNYENELRKHRHEFFNEQCRMAIEKEVNFAYECNLRKDQVQQVELFENAGYKLNLIYMYLQNIDISFQRVHKRIKQRGHKVPEDSIKSNFYEGLANLNKHIMNGIHFI